MRSSFNALINRGPEENFMFTTILLLSVSVYMGVAFKDIAVIKMIKGTAAVQHVTVWVSSFNVFQLSRKVQHWASPSCDFAASAPRTSCFSTFQHPRFIFPAIFFIQLNEPIRLKRKRHLLRLT